MRDMAADPGRRGDDRIARLADRHEAVEIGDGARGHANLGLFRVENFGAKLGADHLDLFDGLEPHLVFVARIAERGARADPLGRSASARGFITLVAGLRLKHSRSWISRFSDASASIRAAVSAGKALAVRAAISITRASLAAGTQWRFSSILSFPIF